MSVGSFTEAYLLHLGGKEEAREKGGTSGSEKRGRCAIEGGRVKQIFEKRGGVSLSKGYLLRALP